MSTLKVLQSFPTQRRNFLLVLGAFDPTYTQVIVFYCENWTPHSPHHMTFQIQVISSKSTIYRTVVYEGSSTCVMFLSCWKDIGTPMQFAPTTMLNDFDGHLIKPLRKSYLF